MTFFVVDKQGFCVFYVNNMFSLFKAIYLPSMAYAQILFGCTADSCLMRSFSIC